MYSIFTMGRNWKHFLRFSPHYIAYFQSPGLLFSLSWNIHRIFLRLCTDSETYCLLCQFFVINYYYKNIASLTLLYWNFFPLSFQKKTCLLWPETTSAQYTSARGQNFQLPICHCCCMLHNYRLENVPWLKMLFYKG